MLNDWLFAADKHQPAKEALHTQFTAYTCFKNERLPVAADNRQPASQAAAWQLPHDVVAETSANLENQLSTKIHHLTQLRADAPLC